MLLSDAALTPRPSLWTGVDGRLGGNQRCFCLVRQVWCGRRWRRGRGRAVGVRTVIYTSPRNGNPNSHSAPACGLYWRLRMAHGLKDHADEVAAAHAIGRGAQRFAVAADDRLFVLGQGDDQFLARHQGAALGAQVFGPAGALFSVDLLHGVPARRMAPGGGRVKGVSV